MNTTVMAEQLLVTATLFLVTAAELGTCERADPDRARYDSRGRSVPFQGQMKSEPAFPPDQCQETANLLEEFADKLEPSFVLRDNIYNH